MPSFVRSFRLKNLASTSIRVVRGTVRAMGNRGSHLLLCFVLAGMLCGAWANVGGQTAHFAGVESVIASNGLVYPHQVAVDSNGNIYFADDGNNRVLKEIPTTNGYLQSTVASAGLNTPTGVAVDGSGNVYIADTQNKRILLETPSGGGYVETVLPIAGLSLPLSLAVDASRNLYISDYSSSRVLKETPSNGNYTQSLVVGVVADGLAVDANGNVYVCAVQNNEVIEMSPNGSGYTLHYVAVGLSQPHGVAVDGNGVVYVAQNNSPQILEEVPSGGTYAQSTLLATGSVQPQALAIDSNRNLYFNDPYGGRILELAQTINLGTQSVGTPSAMSSLIFSFDTGGSIGLPSVVTQGATGLDFADAGTGSCATNGTTHTYNTGDTCTVDVIFTPKYAGIHYGAAELTNSSGNVIARGYAQGTGMGPQLSFLPGAVQGLSIPPLGTPNAIAADGAGNLYISEQDPTYSGASSIVKEVWNGAEYTQFIVATGLNTPEGVAVDGAGNVYIPDSGNRVIYEAIPSAQGYSVGEYQNAGLALGVGVDGAGNVYFAEFGTGVYKGTPVGLTTMSWSLVDQDTNDVAVAVDGQGDFYTLDGSSLLSHTLSNGSYVQGTVVSGLAGTATGIAVSGTGDIYFTDGANSQILKESLINGSYVQSTVMSGSSGDLVSVTVDQSANLYFVTEESDGIWGINYADAPSLSFAATPLGSTSSDSPRTVTVANVGNAPLSFPIPSSGSNPSIATSFSLDENAASACPLVGASSSSAGTLAAGASCALAISFVPAAVSSISGSLVLTDNALNVTTPSYAAQTISLSGTGTQATPSDTLIASANPAFVSNAVTFAATVASSVGTPTGTVSFYDGTSLLGTQSLSGGAAAYATSALAAGTHSITAVYSGDGNFSPLTSAAVTEVVEDFTVGTPSGGSTSATASPGGQAIYTLAMTPPSGQTFAAPITFTVTDLPTGATATFSPASIAAGAGATNVTLTVKLPTAAKVEPTSDPFGRGETTVALGLLLLPFLRRRRGQLGRLGCWILAGVGGAVFFATLAGCGGGGGSGSGGSGSQPQNYTLTVTATSGSLSHTTTLSLTVQ